MNRKEYINLLNAKNYEDDKLFQKLIQETENLFGLSTRDLAIDMKMSVSTIQRWKDGSITPYPLMRDICLSFKISK